MTVARCPCVVRMTPHPGKPWAPSCLSAVATEQEPRICGQGRGGPGGTDGQGQATWGRCLLFQGGEIRDRPASGVAGPLLPFKPVLGLCPVGVLVRQRGLGIAGNSAGSQQSSPFGVLMGEGRVQGEGPPLNHFCSQAHRARQSGGQTANPP